MKRISWITWRLFFITLPVDVFALLFLSNISSLSAENAPRRVAVALIAHVTLVPFFAIAVRVSARINKWIANLLLLFILGAIRGIAIVACEAAFNLPSEVSEGFRVFNSAIAFPSWFIFFAIAIEARLQYLREFKTLFRQIIKASEEGKMKEKSSNERVLSSEEMMARLQSLTSRLGKEILEVLAKSSPKVDYNYESNKIQELINKELRPASKQLWRGGIVSTPDIFRIDLYRIVLFEQRLPINLVILCSAPFLFIGIFGAFGFQIALVQTIVATLPVILSYQIVEKLCELKVVKRRSANVFILGLSYLSPILVQYLLIPDSLSLSLNTFEKFVFQLALWLVLVTLMIGYILYYSLIHQRHVVLTSFESLIKQQKNLEFLASENSGLENIEMSRYLHGEVQTGLTAAILLMQQASKNGDVNLARQGLENAVKILMQNHLELFDKKLMSNEIYLEQIISGWRGIADVSINLESINDLSDAKGRDVMELIAEGIANAIRHGEATKISVLSEEVPGALCIRIRSNGGQVLEGESGLGTELLNYLTSSWNFINRDGQSELTFTVPIG